MKRTRARTLLAATLAAVLVATTAPAVAAEADAVPPPTAVRQGDWILDPAARGVITFGATANVGSFQQDGLLTYGGYQYTAWFQADKRAAISRRALPDGPWESIELAPFLDQDDAHNVISLGVSPRDGRLHMVLGTHGENVRYFQSVPGLVRSPDEVPWAASSFSRESAGLPGAVGAPTRGTYPVFETTSAGELYFTWRDGRTNKGRNVLAKYDDASGRWGYVGQFTTDIGTYTSQWGTSDSRYAYLHGFAENPVTKDLTISWSWRETTAAWCDPNGLGNHDLGFATSPDGGGTWLNNAGAVIGVTGTADQISIADDHVVVPIGINRGLINQEAMTFDGDGDVHVMTSGFNDADLAAIGGCHTKTLEQRAQYAKPYHHWRDASGAWHSVELPFSSNSSGRTKLLFDVNDTAYVVLPDGRIVAATAATEWADWSVVFEDSSVDNIAELIVDRQRLKLEGVLSVAYQEKSATRNAPSAFRVADFSIAPGATAKPKSTEPESPPVPYGAHLPTATASSEQATHPAAHAVDEEPATFWVSDGDAEGEGPQPGRPQVISIEYPKAQTFDRITVMPRNAKYGPRSFAIEAKIDGEWQRLSEVTQGKATETHVVPQTTSDSVRLVITAAWDDGRTAEAARNVQVAEISVGSSDGTASSDDFEAPVSDLRAGEYSTTGQVALDFTTEDPFPGTGVESLGVFARTPGEEEPALVETVERPGGNGRISYTAGDGDGRYGFSLRGTDGSGNTSQPSDEVVVIVDTRAPDLRLTADIETRVVELIATDATSGVERVEYRVDDGDWLAYDGRFTLGGSEASVSYRATDKAGNATGEQSEIVPDASTTVPAKASLSSDNGWDTGLRDGDYAITLNLWWGENAGRVRFYENDVLVADRALEFNSPEAQRAVLDVAGKVNGTYVYRAELSNSTGVRDVRSITVEVTDASPAQPVLSNDNWDGDGSFSVTANLWWGTNATSYQLFENGTPIASGPLTANSPSAQTVTSPIEARAPGDYDYRMEFTNGAGTTASDTMTVTVDR